jgi:uncharacterized protein (TIGR02453 family)
MEFKGFDKAALAFLESIRKNNNKEWFEAHKEKYQKLILEPSRAFVEEMGDHLMALEPRITYEPKINKSLFRIYRDIRRMGADKRPIKHRIGFIFWQGSRKRLQSSGFYMHFSPDELFVAVGIRWFEKPLLDAYRGYIQDDDKRAELQNILDNICASGYKIIDKGYKRLPRGFDAQMSNVELALYKGMATYAVLDPQLITNGDELINKLYEIYEDMLPLQQFMYDVTLHVKEDED